MLVRDERPVVLDRYRLLERLGGGGMGVVWRAQDLKLDREVAVKRIPCGDSESARRADRESLAAARLQHPSIVALYESVAEEDQVWLVSELVDGRTLAAALRDGELSDLDVIEIGIALCDALAHAHKQGVVHRDVKPQNILIAWEGEDGCVAKLTDFGIARLADEDAVTRTGDVVGTLAYMAPEQADGRGASTESDLYSLGICLYEALCGVNPVRGRGVGATARRVGQRLPELGRLRRDLPLELCEAIDDAVWPEPEEGGTLRELRAALTQAARYASDEPGTIAGAAIEPLSGAPDSAATINSSLTRLASALLAVPLAAVPADVYSDALPQQAPWAAPLIASALVFALPRLGWVLTVAAAAIVVATQESGSAAWLLVGLTPIPVLLRRAEPWSWSLPGIGLLLAAIGAAVAMPALAARIASPVHRAAVGLLCAWWATVAQVASGHGLVPGLTTSTPHPSLDDDAIAALVSSPALMFAAVCVTGAVIGPWLAGARSSRLALAGALAWGAALAVAVGVQAPDSALELAAGAVIGGAMLTLTRTSPAPTAIVPLP
ncbi:MAG TPA: serine/threonine-protein kinase [Baekduia sp.]|nr:serine/threonine-protein kinase [Baekduia sp.]